LPDTIGSSPVHAGKSAGGKTRSVDSYWNKGGRGPGLLVSFVQALGVLLLAVLLWGLLMRPDPTLSIFWKGVVPLLPATFLISPILWRSVCPLATLNMVGNRSSGGRRIRSASRPIFEIAGLGLLVAIVPARLFIFNGNGAALSLLILLIGGLAFASGFFFERKAGFCNSICPVLPVEKLYGQYPLVDLNNPRCSDCTACVAKGCLDLAPTKSLRQSLGQAFGIVQNERSWLSKPYGVFAAAFPGFVLGYFLASGIALESFWFPYAMVIILGAASYGLAYVLIPVFKVSRSQSTVILAGGAATVYYWFAIPDLVQVFGLTEFGFGVAGGVRILMIVFVGIWVYRGFLVAGSREPWRRA
jgi:hypothetical protein